MQYAVPIGRVLFALIFIMSGFGHLFDLEAMSGYAASKGVPLPTVATVVTGIMIIAGGLSVLLGYKTKIGAILLAVFLIPTAFMMHAFWGVDEATAAAEMPHFMKDLALAGGALIIAYFGAGPYSLDNRGTGDGEES